MKLNFGNQLFSLREADLSAVEADRLIPLRRCAYRVSGLLASVTASCDAEKLIDCTILYLTQQDDSASRCTIRVPVCGRRRPSLVFVSLAARWSPVADRTPVVFLFEQLASSFHGKDREPWRETWRWRLRSWR